MKNSEVNWSKVEQEYKKCKYEEKYNIKYEVLKYTCTQDNKTYYKVIVSEPFSCNSNWGTTKYKSWNKRVKDVIKLVLNKRYKDIQSRNYKARELEEFFLKYEISREKLFHAPLHEKIDNKPVGYYVKKYDIEVKALKKLKVDNHKNEHVLTRNKFDQLLLNGKCEYCGITISDINQLSRAGKLHTKRARGYSMEIDQINPNGLYTNDNCVASCYWCNNAKTDEFFVDEFKEIARGINLAWQNRLGSEKIVFPEKSNNWNRR